MSNIKKLKKEITSYLLDNPIDIMDEYGNIANIPEWETFEPRDCINIDNGDSFISRKIGSVNVIEAMNYLTEECVSNLEEEISHSKLSQVIQLLFYDLLLFLEKDKVIRRTPETKRQEIKLIVDNTNNESNNRE